MDNITTLKIYNNRPESRYLEDNIDEKKSILDEMAIDNPKSSPLASCYIAFSSPEDADREHVPEYIICSSTVSARF